jgi:hypothetical protein
VLESVTKNFVPHFHAQAGTGIGASTATKLSASPHSRKQENLSEFTGGSGSGEAGYHLESEKNFSFWLNG